MVSPTLRYIVQLVLTSSGDDDSAIKVVGSYISSNISSGHALEEQAKEEHLSFPFP